METDSLDTVLEKLRSGEDEAAEKIFRDFEPYLRSLVRRRLTRPLRSKFDSMDVVQCVWSDLVEGFRAGRWEFKDRDHLRAFLARVTYRHFVNQCRRNDAALRREEPLHSDDSLADHASVQPRPSEVAQAGELWDRLGKLCPPAHREILELKRQGLTAAEIASRVGLHEGSVRRILYDLAKRLAATVDKTEARE
jgi:RNA polymerase sigma-70 factor (ECF subfamily)